MESGPYMGLSADTGRTVWRLREDCGLTNSGNTGGEEEPEFAGGLAIRY